MRWWKYLVAGGPALGATTSFLSTMLVPPYRYLSPAFRIYRPSLARQIARRTPRARFLTTSSPTGPQPEPTLLTQRPYTFHIGVSWVGKPQDPNLMKKVPFPPDTLIGSWRDKMLQWPKKAKSVDAGEDFFFVQEVRQYSLLFLKQGCTPFPTLSELLCMN
jgi:hypothetical protein